MQAEVIGGYRIVSRMGAGAMGTVYRVQDTLGRDLAMKVLPPGSPPEIARRFQREARALARLDGHPGIVRVHAAGEDAGLAYYVMDIVAGSDLRAILARDGPFPAERAMRIAADVARAAHHAHDHGILHRDIKPQNILLGPSGPVLVDFGLARDALTQASLTRAGDMVGTPSYMPPEQAMGEHDRVGPSSDVYGVGATLYALLAGRPPFVLGPDISSVAFLARAIAYDPPPPIPRNDLSPGLRACLDRALAKAPEDRYPTALALAEDLEEVLAGRGPSGARLRGLRGGRLAVALTVFGLAVLTGVAATLLSGRSTEPPAVDPPAGPEPTPGAPGAPTEPAATPLRLYLAGDDRGAVREAQRRIDAGTEDPDDRVVLARASIALGDPETACRLADEHPDDPDLALQRTLAGAPDASPPDEAMDALRAAPGSRPLAHEALACLHLRNGWTGFAAEDLDRAREGGGLGGELAARLAERAPVGAIGSLPPPAARPRFRPFDERLWPRIEAVESLFRVGNLEASRRLLLDVMGGAFPEDGPATLCIYMGFTSPRGDTDLLLWSWVAAERDPVAIAMLLDQARYTVGSVIGATMTPPTESDPGPPTEALPAVVAAFWYYRRRQTHSFAALAPHYRTLDETVRARPWSVPPRLYRGLIALALGYERTARADIEAAIEMARDPAERAMISYAAAEGYARHDPDRARAYLAAYEAGFDVIRNTRRWYGLHLPGNYSFGDLRDLDPDR